MTPSFSARTPSVARRARRPVPARTVGRQLDVLVAPLIWIACRSFLPPCRRVYTTTSHRASTRPGRARRRGSRAGSTRGRRWHEHRRGVPSVYDVTAIVLPSGDHAGSARFEPFERKIGCFRSARRTAQVRYPRRRLRPPRCALLSGDAAGLSNQVTTWNPLSALTKPFMRTVCVPPLAFAETTSRNADGPERPVHRPSAFHRSPRSVRRTPCGRRWRYPARAIGRPT